MRAIWAADPNGTNKDDKKKMTDKNEETTAIIVWLIGIFLLFHHQ